MNAKIKAVLAAVLPLLAAINSWIVTGTLNAPEIALGVTGLVAAFLVAVLRNRPEGVLSAAKFIAAALTPLVSAVIQAAVSGEWSRAEFSTLAVGLLTAVLVYFASETADAGAPRRGSSTGILRG